MASRENPRSFIPVIMVAAGLVLIVGAVVFYMLNPSTPAFTSVPPTLEASIPYPNVPRVGLADARAAYETKSAVFIDVRGDPYYSQSHIPGALNISGDDIQSRLNELDPSSWIITYCT